MTDRELLEAAAKAAGMDVHWGSGWESDYMFRSIPRPSSPLVSNVQWNPLTNSGDAFELVVKLRLNLDCSYADAALCGKPFTQKEVMLERNGEDANAATRRAIVRAAAEIGRSME